MITSDLPLPRVGLLALLPEDYPASKKLDLATEVKMALT